MSDKKKKPCPVCGAMTHFIKTFRSSGACSNKCHGKYLQKKKEEKLSNTPEIACIVCERTFKPVTKHHVKCSPECASIFEKQRLIGIKESDFNIFKRDGFKCIYCGKSSIEDGVKLNIDHIKPVSFGGKTDINNLVTTCSPCNLAKFNTLLKEKDIKRIFAIVFKRNQGLLSDRREEIENQIKVLKSARGGQ